MKVKLSDIKVSIQDTCRSIDEAINVLRVAREWGINGRVDLVVYDLIAEAEKK